MFTTKPGPQLSSKRLDAGYYAPVHLADVEVLRGWEQISLEELRDKNAPIAYGVLKPDGLGDKCRVAKFENFEGMFVRAEVCDPISEQMFSEFRRSQAIAGDILVAIGGHVGRPAMVQSIKDGVRLNINRHLARFRADTTKINPYFALAYMSTQTGERQLTREVTGSVQAGINLEDLRLVSIPIPDPHTQTYIGDKVRQAELLRECADRIDIAAEDALAFALQAAPGKWVADCGAVGMWPNGGFQTRVSFDEIRGRIDPAGYHPELHAIGKRARASTGLFRRLPDVASIVTDKRKRIASDAECSAYISILHVDEQGVVDMSAAAAHRPDSDGRLCLAGDVLLSGINPAANRVGVCRDLAGHVACSPEFSILLPNHDIHPHYLAFVLRSKPCLRQLVHLGQGTSSSRRRVEENELDNLWVPIIGNNGLVGTALANAQSYRLFSARLIDSAKILVEKLIDGSISQEQLGSAQQNLERDDRSLDRAILSQLTEDGIHLARKARLFADIEALYAAIDEAHRTQPSNGDTA